MLCRRSCHTIALYVGFILDTTQSLPRAHVRVKLSLWIVSDSIIRLQSRLRRSLERDELLDNLAGTTCSWEALASGEQASLTASCPVSAVGEGLRPRRGSPTALEILLLSIFPCVRVRSPLRRYKGDVSGQIDRAAIKGF